jgi:hypothetical protein
VIILRNGSHLFGPNSVYPLFRAHHFFTFIYANFKTHILPLNSVEHLRRALAARCVHVDRDAVSIEPAM